MPCRFSSSTAWKSPRKTDNVYHRHSESPPDCILSLGLVDVRWISYITARLNTVPSHPSPSTPSGLTGEVRPAVLGQINFYGNPFFDRYRKLRNFRVADQRDGN